MQAPDVKPQPAPDTKNPDWLKQLKRSVGEKGELKQNNTHAADIDSRIDNDIVSFSQAKQLRNNKKDPHISEARVNSVVDKNTNSIFSRVLDQQKQIGEQNNLQEIIPI